MIARILRRFHFLATCLWLVLGIPTLLWWRESVVWIVIMSWYANFASEFSAWQGSRSEVKIDEQ